MGKAGFTVSDLSMEMSASESATEARPERLSDMLRRVTQSAGERITLGEISDAMAERSFGAFLVVFCLPNLIPLPPGATFILGLPLVFISFQMVFSRLDTIWMPKRLHDYSFDNRAFAAVLDKFLPWMEKAERFIRPRYWTSNPRLFERFVGVFALILALIIFLPIPLGNMGPSYALALMGLGLTERDGIVFAVGAVIGVAFAAIVSYVGYELIWLVPYFFRHIPEYWHMILGFFGH
jgi:hypothetical protein